MRRRALVLLLVAVVATPARAEAPAPTPREGAAHAVPLYGEMVHVYDAPENPYAPGHRGVDVAAPSGTAVHASADGAVSFAGSVAGNVTVTVDHGDGLKTTYSYLGSITVRRGDELSQGHIVGTVGRGHPDSNLPPHVHLSARRDDVYFDPLELYVGGSYADLVSLTG